MRFLTFFGCTQCIISRRLIYLLYNSSSQHYRRVSEVLQVPTYDNNLYCPICQSKQYFQKGFYDKTYQNIQKWVCFKLASSNHMPPLNFKLETFVYPLRDRKHEKSFHTEAVRGQAIQVARICWIQCIYSCSISCRPNI